jgi:hypothetical protein
VAGVIQLARSTPGSAWIGTISSESTAAQQAKSAS